MNSLLLISFISILVKTVFANSNPFDIRNANIYLINLRHRTDKLYASALQLELLGLKFTLIDAVNVASLKAPDSEECNQDILKSITGINILKLNLDDIRKSKKTAAHIGCWLSHLKAFNEILKQDVDKMSLILEDDFVADGNAIELVNKYLAQLEKNHEWDLFYAGHCDSRVNCHRYLDATRKICSTVKQTPCAHAYIVKNKSAAKKLLDAGNLKEPVNADYFFETAGLKRYMVFPHIFKQRKNIVADVKSEGGIHEELLDNSLELIVNNL